MTTQASVTHLAPAMENPATQPRSDATRTAFWIAVLAISGLAIGLRLWEVNGLGFNSDEAVYAGQAAAIARVPQLSEIFPIFRAHPLFFQFTLSLLYRHGASDLLARLLAVGFGLGTVVLTYLLGKDLYGRVTGLAAAAFLGLMPYHVVVSRQALLDVPEVFFATLTLLMVSRLATTEQPRWLYATAGALGLTFLSKETGVVLLPAIYAFLALTPEVKVRFHHVVLSLILFLIVIAPFPLSIEFGGGSATSQSFLTWQLFRPANHVWTFYLAEVPRAVGYLVVLLAAGGLWRLRGGRARWRQRLLLTWILVPLIFFQLWPVKGFQYLLPLAPPIAILAARALVYWPERPIALRSKTLPRSALRAGVAVAVLATLLLSSVRAVTASDTPSFLAGSGGVPGGREAGLWLRDHSPAGSRILAIGPSMANILEFYGRRHAFRLSVSPNPLHRNPAYDPIVNPDLELRSGEIQYIVWDSFSASRSEFFASRLMRYVRRYHGTAVHTETVPTTTDEGRAINEPSIVIYEVRP